MNERISEQTPPQPSNGDMWLEVRSDLHMKYNVTCRHCGNKFKSNASATRFCSDLCLFMANANPTEVGNCWLWKGKSGVYQQTERKKGEAVLAHRFTYELFWGEIKDSNVVRHSCNEPSCVNPFHLFQGTHQQNSNDMTDQVRQAHGERQGSAKLTEEDVREIRADEDCTISELARRYDVARSTIRSVKERKTWQLLDEDMEERRKHGIEKYGVPVQPFNGRDPLIDAYQEVLDLAVYMRQAIEERKTK